SSRCSPRSCSSSSATSGGIDMNVGVRSRGAKVRSSLFAWANLLPFVLFAVFPFYYMVITSLKNDAELYNLKSVPFLIQTGVITDHYRYLLAKTEFLTWIKNSLIISVMATSISLIIAILAGYSLARLRFWGVGGFGTAVFITYLVPTTLLFIPLSQVVNWLGISDTIWALIVTYPTFLVPFSTWLLMGYFRTIPREVEECALVDGATRMQTLLKIVLPMAIPGLVSAALFGFTLTWNEFTYALTFVSQSANKTAVVGVTADLIRGDIYYWGSLMAGAVLASVPVVVCYVLFLDYYVSGLTAGAVKGYHRPPGKLDHGDVSGQGALAVDRRGPLAGLADRQRPRARLPSAPGSEEGDGGPAPLFHLLCRVPRRRRTRLLARDTLSSAPRQPCPAG